MDRNTFNRMLDPFKRKLCGMASRAVVRLVSDGVRMQALQLGLLDGELADGVERFQNYGLTSHPHPGAEAAVIFLGADRGHGVAIAVDDRRYRLVSLQPGEVALYTDEGDVIHLMRDRRIKVSTLHLEVEAQEDVTMTTKRFGVTASEGVTFTTPAFTARGAGGGAASARFEGALHTTGDLTTDADAKAGAVSLRSHTHPETNGAATLPPIGG